MQKDIDRAVKILDEVRDALVSAGNYSGEGVWFSGREEEYYAELLDTVVKYLRSGII